MMPWQTHADLLRERWRAFDAMLRTVASRAVSLARDASIPAGDISEGGVLPSPLARRHHDHACGSVEASGADGTPVIGIAIHQAYVSGLDSAFIDDLIARIESRHARARLLWPDHEADAITRMVAPDGKRLVDVLINSQIMLNPQGRKAEFETLGVPVLQVMPYREGDAADWAADPHGISLTDTPFYLVRPNWQA
jgi:cobaltochelatase CobN